jgi:hypothetical protein
MSLAPPFAQASIRLAIPAAGYRKYENGSVSSVGSGAYLWSRSANEGLNIISGIHDHLLLAPIGTNHHNKQHL